MEGEDKNYIFLKKSKMDLEFQVDWSQQNSKAFWKTDTTFRL